MNGPYNVLDSLWQEISHGHHAHIMFLLGSVVSCAQETKCASVEAIRDDLVLGSLLQRSDGVAGLAAQMSGRTCDNAMDGQSRAIRQRVKDLPFEQFMGCLDAVDSDLATEVIRRTCGGATGGRANANHEYTVETARVILKRGFARTVTIATTNYDPYIESLPPLYSAAQVAVGPVIKVRQCHVQGGELRLLKLHGCITDLASCVFTMRQLAAGIIGWKQDGLVDLVGSPSLLIAIGYSFSDPDLRPLLSQSLSRRDGSSAKVFWNDLWRPTAIPRSYSGPAVLRDEFLSGLDLTKYYSSLFDSSEPQNSRHILAELARRLDIPPKPLPCRICIDDVHHNVAPLSMRIKAMPYHLASEFLGRVVSACDQSESRDLLKPLAFDTGSLNIPAVWFYLHQYGHAHDIAGQRDVAVKLRNRHSSRDACVLARASESFACSIRGDLKSLPSAVWAVFRGLLSAHGCDNEVRVIIGHYSWHFVCKVLQKANYIMPRWAHAMGLAIPVRAAARCIAKRLKRRALRIERLVTSPLPSSTYRLLEVRDAAAEWMLAGQMYLLGLSVIDAGDALTQAATYYSCSGEMNGALQADRAMGWRHLVMGDSSAAARTVGRGLLRAVASHDVSLKCKLGADMIRVLEVLGMETTSSFSNKQGNRMSVDDCLRELLDGDGFRANASHAEALRDGIREWYPGNAWQRLQADVWRTRNARWYPIFLPADPPILDSDDTHEALTEGCA